MTVTIHDKIIQGTEEWYAIRCGMLTASEMKHIITPSKLQFAQNDKARAHIFELLAQRVTKYVEPHYISDDMLRGKDGEIAARDIYSSKFGEVKEVGFITNDKFGFTLGFSPDGLVGDDIFIETKRRCQKYQIQTIIENKMPEEYLLQAQTGFVVSERSKCDFISYSGGMKMLILRIHPDDKVTNAIVEAAGEFERKMSELMQIYHENSKNLIQTERPKELEIAI